MIIWWVNKGGYSRTIKWKEKSKKIIYNAAADRYHIGSTSHPKSEHTRFLLKDKLYVTHIVIYKCLILTAESCWKKPEVKIVQTFSKKMLTLKKSTLDRVQTFSFSVTLKQIYPWKICRVVQKVGVPGELKAQTFSEEKT